MFTEAGGKGLEHASGSEGVQRELSGRLGEFGGGLAKTDEDFVQSRRVAEQTQGSGKKERLDDFLA